MKEKPLSAKAMLAEAMVRRRLEQKKSAARSGLIDALPRVGEEPAPRSLIALQPRGERPPLFCVHPVGGGVFCYGPLARLLEPETPVYALQAIGIEGEDPPRERIDEMAAAYLDEVRRVAPRGPYHLGGWSMGGLVAFEMAQQLARAGEEVASLILIDSAPRCIGDDPAEHDERALLAGFVADLEGVSAPSLLPSVSDSASGEEIELLLLRVAERHMGGLASLEQARRLLAVFRNNLMAIERYSPEPYPGSLLLIHASSSAFAALFARWQKLALGGVELYEVAADHYDLLKPPHVDAVAMRIRRLLTGEPT